MQNIKYLIALLPVFWILSCEDEEIGWKIDEAPGMLVVEGSFTNEMKHHRIILSKSADYFINKSTPAVSGAEVTITSDSLVYEFEEVPGNPGVYESVHRIAGVPGKTYTLNIHLQNPIHGETFYQAHELMIEGIDLDSMAAFVYNNPMYVEQAPMDSVILIIYLYGDEPQDMDNLYSVSLYKNGELLQDTVDEVQIYSDTEEMDGAYVNSLFFFETFQGGDTIAIEISTVTNSYRQFVTGIRNVAGQSGNPFDLSGPPANAVGNVQGGEALGYFRVSYVSRTQALVEDRRDE